MLNPRHNANDAGSRLAELLSGNETIRQTIGQTTEDPAQLSVPSEPKRYALPIDWEQHKEKIRQLYLDENKSLRKVMAIMGRDHGHFGSVKQFKNKLREWKFDTKYKRHQASRPRRQSGLPGRSLAFMTNANHSQALDDNYLQAPDIERADDNPLQATNTRSADAHLFEAPESEGAIGWVFQAADPSRTIEYLFQAPTAQDADRQHFGFADTSYAVEYFSQVPHAQDTDDGYSQAANTSRGLEHVFQPPNAQNANDEHSKVAGTGLVNTLNDMPQASANSGENCQLALSQAVGIRSGRSATPPMSIAERIFSLAQQHIETSFTYGVWKVNSNNTCTSLLCTKEEMDLPETYFDLIRSAVLLFQQGLMDEGQHAVSKAFALVKPIIKSGNVRALNFFWTSLIFLVQFGHALIANCLVKYIYEMARILLHPKHSVVQMFELLTRIDVLKLEPVVHTTWQITADAFQRQLPKLHPEYVRHQCDLIFRVYGTKDAATAERRLRQLLKDCQDTAQTPELSHMTVLNALGYNFTNSKDWVQAVNIGQKLEERARASEDIDLLVYQIGGMEIQARAFNELKLIMPAVKCLKQATPLIAAQWGNDDPWRVELMALQQNWLRENGEIEAADELKAEISSITETIDTS